MTDTKQRKTGKAEMKSAVDSFLWNYHDSTGGTSEENHRGAAYNLTRIEKHAAIVTKLASNASKPLLADSHLMEYALELIPAKVTKFREMYLPTNIIQFQKSA